MRRFWLGLVILSVAAEMVLVTPAMAQPFGFLFGGHARHRTHVARRRGQERVQRVAVEIPFPPARPHFAEDTLPVKNETAAAPPPETPKPDAPPSASSAPDTAANTPPSPPTRPADLAPPTVAPSGAKLGETPGQPAEDATCVGRLKARGVDVERIVVPPQPDARCTVVEAVRLNAMTLADGAHVDFPDHPTIACPTADVFSLYVRDLLVPLAKGTYGAPVSTVWTGPGLECRSRDHIVGAKLSAHGQGLAIDIAQLKLANGRLFEVGKPTGDSDNGFEAASRAAGCGYFHTVLGPGSDSYHRNHWHFDLEVRGAKGTSKFCQ